MTITTDYNVGDMIYTVNPDTLKIIETKIESIYISVYDDKPKITYGTKTGDDFKGYEASKCFASAEELMRHLSQK